MKKFLILLLVLAACDLQPKITSVPDTVGEFISARYPAMLADPETQPEIYNSAVLDYGTYNDVSLYGVKGADLGDYTMYASASDYTLQSPAPATTTITTPTAAAGPIPVAEPVISDYLKVPDYTVSAPLFTSADTSEITVAAGDTLYSLSRKYEIPVNDLAIMNNLSAPFVLGVGQKIKVLKTKGASDVTPAIAATTPIPSSTPADTKPLPATPVPPAATAPVKTVPATTAPVVSSVPKVSSDPNAKLPKIASRASKKFSWPVKGKILSSYGDKGNGLFNDGINISAKLGTTVAAAENGVVAYAGNELKGMGNLVIVQHADGFMTVYAHMDNMVVKRGAKVNVGQKLGTVGQTGKVSQPQLHFEIRKGTKAYDPQKELKK